MTLSNLIKKGGLASAMTATVATGATVTASSASCVAGVATVAVAEGAEPVPELSTDEETRIRAWLTYIEETEPVIISSVLDKCRNNLGTRRFLLKLSQEVLKAATIKIMATAPKVNR